MRTVSFTLPASSLAYWDAAAHRWTVEADAVELQAGASSADIRARRTVRVSR
jgi:beta-glucosidase